MHSRVTNREGILTFNKSYHEEGPYDHEGWGNPAIMQQFKISTYINTLISHGFKIEKVHEEVWCSEEDIQSMKIDGTLTKKQSIYPPR